MGNWASEGRSVCLHSTQNTDCQRGKSSNQTLGRHHDRELQESSGKHSAGFMLDFTEWHRIHVCQQHSLPQWFSSNFSASGPAFLNVRTHMHSGLQLTCWSTARISVLQLVPTYLTCSLLHPKQRGTSLVLAQFGPIFPSLRGWPGSRQVRLTQG